jgi:polysaccharide deacetylase family protein (PEP-CTERM system associated)
MRNALSFDVDELEPAMRESTGQPLISGPSFIAENTEHTLRILEEFGVRATFFINGRSVERCPGLVRRIHDCGHEIGVHSYSHRFLQCYEDAAAFRSDLQMCLDLIGDQIDERPIGYRAPGNTLYGNHEIALSVLRECGFEYSSSLPAVGHREQHGYSRGPEGPFQWDNGIVELPMPSVRFSGMRFPVIGAHALRLFPYAFTARGLHRLNNEGRRGFLYLHSFEMFDQAVTRECLWFSLAQRIYLARRGPQMERKLRRLLGEFEFAPYRDFLDSDFLREVAGIPKPDIG